MPVITEVEAQLFPINLKYPQCKKKLQEKPINQTLILSGGHPLPRLTLQVITKSHIEPSAKVV